MLPQAANKEVLAAYGRFYSLLLQSGADSWEEYLMDQVWGECATKSVGWVVRSGEGLMRAPLAAQGCNFGPLLQSDVDFWTG